MPEQTLPSKVALITGAARRIGAEITRTLHGAGMNVVLHYNLSQEEAQALAHELNQVRAHSAIALRADLHEAGSDKILIQQAVKEWGRLDALINNASQFYRTPIAEVTEYAWQDLMGCNLKAPFFLSHLAAPHLTETKGCIVNVTDIHAERPLRDYSIYCISKSGLLMTTRVLAKELGPHVRVNAVAPGPIIWPEGKNELTSEDKSKIISQTALQRVGSPLDIAKAILFFVRDADYITGQVLDVDGGRTLSG